jgi:hypothetical protein
MQYRMDTMKQWAKGWETRQAPQRDGQCDAFFAEFTDSEGNSVRVEIQIQDLREFGKAFQDFRDEARHTEEVLRAVLETYIQKLGKPPVVINAKDLSMYGLGKLKKDFRDARTEDPDT